MTATCRLFVVLVLSIAMEWPDWSLADRLTNGFKVTGVIGASNLYVEAAAKNVLSSVELLSDADAWNRTVAADVKETESDALVVEETVRWKLMGTNLNRLPGDGGRVSCY